VSTVAEQPDVVSEQTATLAVVKEANVSTEVAQNLQASFAPMFSGARDIISRSKAIVVTDPSQKLETKLAREYRLALKTLRIDGDKTRKALKEESLRRGKAIDGFFNILLDIIAPEEARLEEQEKFVERKEAERKAAMKLERESALKPYGIDTSFFSLGEMPDESFAQLLENTRVAHEAKLAAARKAEEERIARENAELKERERVRLENERLKKEAAEREEAAKIERERHAKEKADAEAAALAERQRVEAEQRAAAEKARLEREEIERKAKAEQDAIRAQAEAARKEAEETARQEKLRLQALAEVERQKADTARLAAEAEAKAQREAREKLEAEALAAKQAAEKAEAERAEAVRQASLAPDREKLIAFADQISALKVPGMFSTEAQLVEADLRNRIEKLAAWIKREASVL
jgi:hypothetical protein